MLDEIRDYLVAFRDQCEAEIEAGKDSLNEALASASVSRLSKLIAAIDDGLIAEVSATIAMQATVQTASLTS